ncbi:hypothetical protein TNCV_314121 [Trichonephila clavipes]|nr:hypothetical protein TNCV_314121 [Trichonephila clavipes]
MTDDNKTTGPAFKKVFTEGVKHLLCKWHLHRAWKKQLNNLVSCFEIRNEIYASLIVFLEEKNLTKFKQMMENFGVAFVDEEPAFIKYFDDYYYNLWCMSDRQFPHSYTAELTTPTTLGGPPQYLEKIRSSPCPGKVCPPLLYRKMGNSTKAFTRYSERQSCDTRWEAKIDSVKAVYIQFEQTRNSLEEFIK